MSNDKKMGRIIHGAVMIDTERKEESMALLDSIKETGCTAFDTAHVYADGRCESMLGIWMDERKNREDVYIISKCCHYNNYRRRVTPYDIGSDLLDSLSRLKTDYIDMYMTHRDDPGYPVGPIVEAFNEHINAGRIRAWGVTNWTFERVREANDYAREHGLIPCAAASAHYSLAVQVVKPWGEDCLFGYEGVSETITGDDMANARAWYAETQLPFLAYSPLGRGLFSGLCTRENHMQFLDEAAARAYAHEENFKRLDRVTAMAKEKGCSIPQLALAWLLHQPLDVRLLVGAYSADELVHDMEAFKITLTAQELAWLNVG